MPTTPAARAEKLPYTRPVLKIYGDLSQLTQAKGRTGQSTDSAIANNNKTQ
jgi:hypothetical protein